MGKVKDITTLHDLIDNAVVQTANVFSLEVEQLESFHDTFATIVVEEILAGFSYGRSGDERLYGFTSASSIPTSNMKQALMETGISTTGTLPEGYCFLSTFLPITGELLLDAQLMKEELAFEAANKASKKK